MFFYFSFLCNSLFYMYPMYDFYNNTSNIIMEWFGLFMVTHSRSLSYNSTTHIQFSISIPQ